MTKKTKDKQVEELDYREPDCKHCKLAGKVRGVGWGVDGAKTLLILSHPVKPLSLFLPNLLAIASIDFKECYYTYACLCNLES